jgi:DNA repair protein RecN (Recombination protein N)
LAAAVTALLPELGMPDGQFDVTLTPLETIGAGGAEGVQFLAALNAGGEMPLARIASGGELAHLAGAEYGAGAPATGTDTRI